MSEEKAPLRITATSYVLPGARGWRVLSQEHRLDFGEYGDWPQALLEEDPETAVVWILLFDDLVAEELLSADDAYEHVVPPLLSLLGERLRRASSPTLVAWQGPRPSSPIVSARRQRPSERLVLRFRERLYDLAGEHPGLLVLSLDEVFADIGRKRSNDARNFYAAHSRFSPEGIAALADAVRLIFNRVRLPARKVLILDCDNTLWGGVVGEDGVGGLKLGQDGDGAAFVDFQRVIKRFAAEGLILALASKNNEGDVWEVFDHHPSMVLKRDDISAWRIDWKDKAENIASIAEELGVGLESVAFWDDNPLEREKVRAELPQVAVLDVAQDIVTWPEDLARSPEFAKLGVTDEDRRKTEQYRARGAFVRAVATQGDRFQFLRSIALRPEALPLDRTHVARAAQLCAKTNQFNLRTVRHSESDLLSLSDESGCHVLVRLSDRFGDHGIVGLIVARVTETDPTVGFLDTFLMSCRVLGRELEAWMLDLAIQETRQLGVKHLVAEYVPSPKNAMVAPMLATRGFSKLEEVSEELSVRLMSAVSNFAQGRHLYVADTDVVRIQGIELYDRPE